MKDKIGPWVCEWSETQKCFNVETVQACIDRNHDVFTTDGKYSLDWILMGIFPTIKEANAEANRLKIERGIPSLVEQFAKQHYK